MILKNDTCNELKYGTNNRCFGSGCGRALFNFALSGRFVWIPIPITRRIPFHITIMQILVHWEFANKS